MTHAPGYRFLRGNVSETISIVDSSLAIAVEGNGKNMVSGVMLSEIVGMLSTSWRNDAESSGCGEALDPKTCTPDGTPRSSASRGPENEGLHDASKSCKWLELKRFAKRSSSQVAANSLKSIEEPRCDNHNILGNGPSIYTLFFQRTPLLPLYLGCFISGRIAMHSGHTLERIAIRSQSETRGVKP